MKKNKNKINYVYLLTPKGITAKTRLTINFMKIATSLNFNKFLIMPPAYYKGNTDEGVFEFYSRLISAIPKVKIILYNFEKLSGYKFSAEMVTKLVKDFPENIIGCKDSSYKIIALFQIWTTGM